MKIVIAGAGEVGFELGRILSEENHDVIIIDERPNCIARVEEQLDVISIEGNATSANTLVDAGVRNADLMVAVTSVDEVNIIASMMAKKLGARKVIARVRNDELTRESSPITPEELGIDVMIHPEETAANDIFQQLKRASATDVVELAEGTVQLIGVRVEEGAELAGQTLSGLHEVISDFEFRVVAISRRGRTIIPRGFNKLLPLDHVFIVAKTEHVKRLILAAGHDEKPLRRVMITGGTDLSRRLVRKLHADTKRWDIKVAEPNSEQADQLAVEIPESLVMKGAANDINLLVSEGLQDMDAFVSVSDDEESNIILSLIAKHLGVKKTVALVSKTQYIPLGQTIGIDAIVNIKSSAADEIHRQIRQVMMFTVKALPGIRAEIVEVEAGDRCKMRGRPIQDLKFPNGMVIGAIVRNGKAQIATGASVIEKGDHIIIFALPSAITDVENLF